MSEQDEGPKDDLERKNAAITEDDIDQDREAILARRKFLVLGAMSTIVVTGQACEPIQRIIGRPFACLSPAPTVCLTAPPAPISEIPCLTPVWTERDASAAVDSVVDAGSVAVESGPGLEPGPLACLSVTAPQACLSPPRVNRDQQERDARPRVCLSPRPHPPPLQPPCLTPVRGPTYPEPMACLNVLRLSGDGDGEDQDV